MSKRRATVTKNPKVNNTVASLDLITLDKEIKEAEEKLDELIAKRKHIYENIIDSTEHNGQRCSYFY